MQSLHKVYIFIPDLNQESRGMEADKATMLDMESENEPPGMPHREAEWAERGHTPVELCELQVKLYLNH